MNQDELKQQVGREAVKYIRPGMVVGLGTGTTVHCLVEALGEHVKNGDLSDIVCVTTSNRTTRQAQSLGIKVEEIDDVDHIDLTIDGADEISDNFQGIKGGGGALLWEKIVSNYSDHVMWIVDESKLVHHLGAFPLPVEVTPYGSQHLFTKLARRGYNPTWRMLPDNSDKFRTHQRNFIIDLHLEDINDPFALHEELIGMVGLNEDGLFLNQVNDILVGTQDGPKFLHARP